MRYLCESALYGYRVSFYDRYKDVRRSITTKRQGGFTLIELMVSVAVFAIGISVAVPTMNHLLAKQRFKAALETTYFALLMARSEAVKSNRAVTAVFQTGANWGIRLSDSENCAVLNVCTAGDWLQVTQGSEFKDSNLTTTSFAAAKTAFDPIRGTANAGNVSLVLGSYAGKVELTVLGYPRLCAANAFTVQSLSYPAC